MRNQRSSIPQAAMPRPLLVTLRVLLALFLLGCLAVQVLVAPLAATALDGGPHDGVLVALVIAGLLCVEAVLVATWRLSTLAHQDRLFDRDGRTDLWVDTAMGAFVLGAVLATAAAVFFAVVLPVPIAVGLFVLGAVASGSLALVVVVMRRLLHAAVEQRSELAEVV